MDFVEVLERVWQLRQHRRCIAQVHAAHVVALEDVQKLSAMPLLCGLQTGVLIGFRPNDLAMPRVSCAI